VGDGDDLMRIAMYPEDRQRLLDNGEMNMTVYSGRDHAIVSRWVFRAMTDVANLMCLALSEPILEAGPVDGFGAMYPIEHEWATVII